MCPIECRKMDNLSLLGTSIKYIRSKKETGGQSKSVHLFFLSYKGEGLSENYQIWAGDFMDGSLPKFIYVHVAMFSTEIKIWYLWFSYTIFYTKFNIFYINSIKQDHFITVETIVWSSFYIKGINISFILENLILFYYWATF